MDKIWYRNPSKSQIIGRCGGDEKNRMTTQNRQKSKRYFFYLFFILMGITLHAFHLREVHV